MDKARPLREISIHFNFGLFSIPKYSIVLKDTWKGGAEHGGAGSRRFAWLFQPHVNRRTSPPRSLSATKREISDVEIEVEILKNGIMSKGFTFAF